MSPLNEMIRKALGKYIQTVADGAGKTDPTDLAVSKAIFPDIGSKASMVEGYISTAYGATDETKEADVVTMVGDAITVMKKLGLLP